MRRVQYFITIKLRNVLERGNFVQTLRKIIQEYKYYTAYQMAESHKITVRTSYQVLKVT
jgi:predicted transcriptional regulator